MRKQKVQFLGGLAGALLVATAFAPAALAWGPERPTYTNENPADHATFNSITNNAAVGDERDFVRIVEKGTGNTYTSDLTLEAGKQYEVYIYYHNDASATYNDPAHNYAGVARDVRVSTNFPDELARGERGEVSATISASNTDPLAVWDEAYITAKEAMTLHYVEGSAKIYNQRGANGSVLSTNIFSKEGTFIGLDELNGIILGCDQYSGQIVYTIQTKSAGTPPTTPVEPENPTDPEVPKELPNTGPAEIALAIVIVLAIGAGIVYWQRTRTAVKKVTRRAKGRK